MHWVPRLVRLVPLDEFRFDTRLVLGYNWMTVSHGGSITSMPYLTYYSLQIESQAPAEHKKALAVLLDSSDEAVDALFATGDPNKWCRWYEHEDDMRRLSSRFPDMLFTLSGTGEEYDDIWVKYFKAGRVQASYATIVLDPFDETKLA